MTLQSIFAFGAVVGCILMPIFSDIKGKVLSTDISLLCCIAGNLLYSLAFIIPSILQLEWAYFLVLLGLAPYLL